MRRVEIWYVVIDGQIVTGTPGPRHWLANLREHRGAVLHLQEPAVDLPVTALEVTDLAARRRVAERAWRLQLWYAQQPYSVDDWVSSSPMVRPHSKSASLSRLWGSFNPDIKMRTKGSGSRRKDAGRLHGGADEGPTYQPGSTDELGSVSVA
ncbi:MAG: hypothetical protein WCA30_14610 [Dermatophilaceae bacterium]